MTDLIRLGLAAGLVAALAGAPADAQTVPYVYEAPNGPVVLQTDRAGRVIAPATRPDVAARTIPVPQVMNGGGFGISGFDYYDDQFSESRLGVRKQPKQFVLAPAYIAPPLR